MRHSLFLLAALSAISSAQDLPAVSYETRAANAQSVVRDLGKQLGTTISLSPDLMREILVVRVKNIGGSQLLEKLAEALSADLKKTDAGWRIERTSELRALHLAADNKKLVDLLKAWSKEQEEGQKQPQTMASAPAEGSFEEEDEEPMPPEEAAKVKRYQELYQKQREASTKLWKAVRMSLSSELIASVGLSQRLVLSSAPNSRQRPLGAPSLAAIKEYNTQVADLLKGLSKDEAEDWADSLASPIQRILVSIERNNPFNWEVRARGFDKNHEEVFNQGLWPTAGNSRTFMFDEGPQTTSPETKLKLNDPKTVIPSPGAFKTLSVFVNAVSQGSPPPMVDQKEMLAFFRDPAKNEPLGQTATTALFALADDQKANLVAVVPDDAFGLEGASMMNRTLDLRGAVAALEGIPLVDLSSQDQWVVMKSGFPSLSEKCRLNREALQELAEAESSTGGLSMLMKGQFMLTYPEYSTNLWQVYAMFVVPGLMGGMFEGGSDGTEGYRFFASLNPPDRDQLMSGKPVPMSRMSPVSRDLFERCINDISDLKGENPELKSWFMRWGGDEKETEEAVPYKDVTDFPQHVMAQSYVLGNVITDHVAKLVGNDLSLFMGTMDAEGIAMLRQMKESPEMAQWASMMPDFNRFRPGTRTRLDLKFVLAQPYGGRALINGTQMSGDANGVSYDRLPRPFLDAIKKAEDAYKQLMQGAGEGPVVPTEQPGTKP